LQYAANECEYAHKVEYGANEPEYETGLIIKTVTNKTHTNAMSPQHQTAALVRPSPGKEKVVAVAPIAAARMPASPDEMEIAEVAEYPDEYPDVPLAAEIEMVTICCRNKSVHPMLEVEQPCNNPLGRINDDIMPVLPMWKSKLKEDIMLDTPVCYQKLAPSKVDTAECVTPRNSVFLIRVSIHGNRTKPFLPMNGMDPFDRMELGTEPLDTMELGLVPLDETFPKLGLGLGFLLVVQLSLC
jgi:hypothetical protein